MALEKPAVGKTYCSELFLAGFVKTNARAPTVAGLVCPRHNQGTWTKEGNIVLLIVSSSINFIVFSFAMASNKKIAPYFQGLLLLLHKYFDIHPPRMPSLKIFGSVRAAATDDGK